MLVKTVKDLKDFLTDKPDDMPITIFDGNEGDYFDVKVSEQAVSRDTSWARFTALLIVIEATE